MKTKFLSKLLVISLLLTAVSSKSADVVKCSEVDLPKLDIQQIESREQNELQQVKDSKNLSQLLRSNAPHFWTWAKQRMNSLNSLERQLVSFSGIIMGDSHLGNMHPTLDPETGRMIWKNIDLDDSGVGSFAYDFLHFVLSVKVINKDLKIRDQLDAYKKGLNGENFEPPKSIRKLLDISAKEYEEMRSAYVTRKTETGKIKLKKGEVIKFDSKTAGITREDLEKIIKQNLGEKIEVLDLALLPKDRGGSAGKRRIWALLNIEGKQHIFEIKELDHSGLEYFDNQLEIEDNFIQNRNYFGYKEKDLPIVQFDNANFIIREKKITLFDVPYDPKTKEDEKFLEDLAAWGSYNLGKWHAGQANSQAYTQAVNANSEVFLDLVKKLRKEYLKIVLGVYSDDE